MEQLEQLEEFYNFKDLCYAVLHKDLPRARARVEAQAQCLFQSGNFSVSAMRIFLTSMNRSIYNYLLFTLDISLHQCCFQNSTLMHKCDTREQFYSAAEGIIRAYCGQFTYAVNCNCYVMKAKEYIEEHLGEDLSLETVATQVYISKAYLSELFTACTGQTYSAYVTERRLERARQLLLSTRMTVHDVGQACGFPSSAYFSTVFTKRVGVPPRRFRALAAENGRHSA